MCVGLIFQFSAQAASLPQAEAMMLADCSKMNHHASDGSDHSGHTGEGQDMPCSDMSLKCMLSMNAVSPLMVENNLPALPPHVLLDQMQFSAAVADQLLGRAVSPDYPPPRF